MIRGTDKSIMREIIKRRQKEPIALTVMRTENAAMKHNIERLRAALAAAERKLDYADRESNPHDLIDWARGALEIIRAALEPPQLEER